MTFIIDPGSFVASGAQIDMNATEINYTVATLNQIPQVPGKSTGSSYNFRLPKGKSTGFEAPVTVVQGVIDTGTSNYTNPDSSGMYRMTGSMLKGLALTGSMVAVIDNKAIVATPTGGGSMIYCMVNGYNLTRNNMSHDGTDSGYIMGYQIDLTEVQV